MELRVIQFPDRLNWLFRNQHLKNEEKYFFLIFLFITQNKTKHMKAINISLRLSNGYQNNFVDIQKTDYKLSFKLKDGKHQVITELTDIGRLVHLNNSTLQAQFSFSYEFDEKNNVLTLCGADYASKDSMCLTTLLKGTDQKCHQRSFESLKGDGTSLFNLNWNHDTQMTPYLQEGFVELVKKATNDLIEVTRKIDGLTVHIRTTPPYLSTEEYSKYLLVYKDGKFLEFHDPDKDYDYKHKICNILSVWGGSVMFKWNENFANVIGSTGDKKIAGLSWLQLWEKQFGQAKNCASLDYNNFNCHGGLVGGHVISGTKATIVPHGVNYVYIIPICTAHNNDDNVYMAAIEIYKGIWLKNYHNP